MGGVSRSSVVMPDAVRVNTFYSLEQRVPLGTERLRLPSPSSGAEHLRPHQLRDAVGLELVGHASVAHHLIDQDAHFIVSLH